MNDKLLPAPNPFSEKPKVRGMVIKDIVRENIPWFVLIIISTIFSFLFPHFLTFRNITNIFRNSSLIGIVAIGMTFAMIGGTFDLSVGTVLGLSTVITIQMQPTTLGSSLYIITIAMASGAFVGFLNGLIVGRWRTNSIITTIGTSLSYIHIHWSCDRRPSCFKHHPFWQVFVRDRRERYSSHFFRNKSWQN